MTEKNYAFLYGGLLSSVKILEAIIEVKGVKEGLKEIKRILKEYK